MVSMLQFLFIFHNFSGATKLTDRVMSAISEFKRDGLQQPFISS
jgi:hypothetical protein